MKYERHPNKSFKEAWAQLKLAHVGQVQPSSNWSNKIRNEKPVNMWGVHDSIEGNLNKQLSGRRQHPSSF